MSDVGITRRQAAAAALSMPMMAAAGGMRPNVLLLHCHDLGQHLGCYGVDSVSSPNLDRFASEGCVFERSYATAPQCSPSRASIFTGRYPHSNGVMGLTHADFAWDLHADEKHLGQLMKSAGYATSAVGVIHETRSGPQRCGFDSYTPPTRARAMADAVIAQMSAMARVKDKPFYLQAGCIEPHRLAPATPDADQNFTGVDLRPDVSKGLRIPPYLRDTEGTRTELAELQGAVRHMDGEMGRVLEAVRQLGLERNTLVIFTTDHGIAMPRAKGSLYEPGLLTSSVWRYPAMWGGGLRQKAMISNVDYLPTICELAGVALPAGVQGRSLLGLLRGEPYAARTEIFGELTYHDYYDPRRSVRTERHKLIVNFSSAPAFMDPSQSWRPRSDTVVPANHALAYHPAFEFYDLQADPWERRDLAGDRGAAGAIGDLRGRLWRHLRETRDPILEGAVTSPLHLKASAWLRGG